MRKILLMSCVCVFALPAAAQDNAITIIREDGSKEVIPLGGNNVEQDSVVRRRAPRVETVPHAPVIERASKPVSVDAARDANINAVATPAQSSREEIKATPKVKPKKVAGDSVPKPMRKPHRRVLDVPSGEEPISRDKALYIALSEAPPSRDVNIKQVEDDQGLLYSVMFKTEEGGYEVLVDAYSGVIVGAGAIENGQAIVQPGHLPVR